MENSFILRIFIFIFTILLLIVFLIKYSALH